MREIFACGTLAVGTRHVDYFKAVVGLAELVEQGAGALRAEPHARRAHVNDFFSRRNFKHKKDPDSRKGRAAPLPKTKERKTCALN